MGIFYTIFYQPIHNIFVFLIVLLPSASVPLAIILLVIIIRCIIYPFTKKAWIVQKKLEKLSPEIKKIQQSKKEKKQQGEKILKIYKHNNINPLSILFSLFLNLAFLLSIFFVINDYANQSFMEFFDPEYLYNFLEPLTTTPSETLFGKNIRLDTIFILGLFAAITQYISIKETQKNRNKDIQTSNFVKNLNFQMLYFLPIFLLIISFYFPSALILYWLVNNLFSYFQEKYLQKYYL